MKVTNKVDVSKCKGGAVPARPIPSTSKNPSIPGKSSALKK